MQYRPARRPSDKTVSLRVADRVRTVSVLDVSAEGLKIALSDPLPPGTEVVIATMRLRVVGTVRWWRQGRAGILLAEPADTATQAELSGAWSA
ncbi:MAG: PilZ domain-containing protein [Pseudomonadota bacterium]